MKKLPLKVLTDLVLDALNTTNLDADSPSGELSSRLEMDAQLRLLFKRPLTLLLDMDPSANKTDLLQLSSQKSSKTVITPSRFALKSPREYSQL